jgi:hypothetical protein
MTGLALRIMRGSPAMLGVMLMCGRACGLEAEVRTHQGSPMIFVDGEPVSPLMFFGWARYGGPTVKTIDTEWKEYHITITAPEDNEGKAGIHFRVGGAGPGAVWADNVKFYPGPKVEAPAENWARQGDWEGTREEISRDWTLFQAEHAGAEAEWTLDPATKVTGAQSLRIDIKNAGKDRMHLHFFQSGYTVKKGERYTYSLWMKADKPRVIDFMALRIGEPWTIYGAARTDYEEQVRLAREAGVHLHSFGITMPWPKPGEEPNFAATDRAIELTLANDPEALLLPRFGMNPPGWWLDAHPDDRMLFDDGQTRSMSMASEAWREEMQERLRALVRHCEEKYGEHMLGYHPCGQHTGEWFYERSWEPRLSDFSVAMNRGFARWVEAKYRTVEALREAWNDEAVSFEPVAVPSKEEQLHTELGLFRDPAAERKVIDYFEYKQLAMEEPLETMARVIKEETQGKKLVCLFYGYIFDMHGIPMGPQTSGHLAMAKLVKCPEVDILCSPISYLDRQLGGAGCFMCAVDTVRDAGKLWLNEDDTRTYLTPEDAGFGRVGAPQGTFWVHQRNFAQLWPRRLACWYMDLGGIGWLNGKDIWDNIAPLQSYYQEHIEEPARWAPEVALIVDEVSPLYTKCTRDLHSPLVYQMRSQYFRMGTPFRINLLSDLVEGRLAPAEVYFFANCFRLDKAQREAVKEAIRGKTAVFCYGNGFLGAEAADENMREITGMRLEQREPPADASVRPGMVTPEAGGGPLTEGLDEDFGTKTVLDPRWVVSEEGVEIVGRYEDGSVAVAARQTPEGLRVYVGALHCPARLLRNIVKRSGVHLYVDTDDVLLTDSRFLCLSASSKGHKTIRLPDKRDVISVPGGQRVALGVDRLDLDMELGETRMFALR